MEGTPKDRNGGSARRGWVLVEVVVWRLTARCPECHAPVRLRNSDYAIKMLELALGDPDIGPNTILQTYQCANQFPDKSLCNAMVEIKVKHWKKMPNV